MGLSQVPPPAVRTSQAVPIIVGVLPVGFVAVRMAMWLLGFGTEDADLGPALLAVGYFAPAIAALAWVWFFAVWREPGGWHNVGLTPLSGHWLRVAIFTGFGCLLLAGLMIAVFAPILGLPNGTPPFLRSSLREHGLGFLLCLLVLVCVAAPLAEELIFRGVLFAWLRQRWGLGPAAMLAALPHAFLHLDPVAMPALTVTFIIFAVLYENAGSLWAPVIAHGVYNFASAVWSLSTVLP